jgi:hypothetical protein
MQIAHLVLFEVNNKNAMYCQWLRLSSSSTLRVARGHKTPNSNVAGTCQNAPTIDPDASVLTARTCSSWLLRHEFEGVQALVGSRVKSHF